MDANGTTSSEELQLGLSYYPKWRSESFAGHPRKIYIHTNCVQGNILWLAHVA
jgi:hypothetical protein